MAADRNPSFSHFQSQSPKPSNPLIRLSSLACVLATTGKTPLHRSNPIPRPAPSSENGMASLIRRPVAQWLRRQGAATACSTDLLQLRRFGAAEVPASEQMNLIRKLRERTSAPIKDVKSALVGCNWDLDEAQKDLRKRGVVLAAKKSARTAAEGLLAVAQDEKRAVVVELNCETDFVARNDVFQYLASSLARKALLTEGSTSQSAFSFGPEYLESATINLEHPKLSGETTVQGAVTEVAAMVGENVKFRRGFILSTSSHGAVSTYLHTCPQPGLGRIAGLVTLEVEDESASLEPLKAVGSSLAMHIVASKPLFLSKELVPAQALQSERDILKTQAEASGKPQMAIEKMVEGRLRKYFEEVVLLEQKFVLNDSKNIKTVLNELSKEVGSKVNIGNFMRVEIGEGIARSDPAEAN